MRTLAGILLLGLAAVPTSAQPTVAFEPSALVAKGVTPGGSVVWFEIARVRPRWTTQVVRRDVIIADDDADGVVRLELKDPVPARSIWTAVDLATGAFTVATPDTMPRREVALPGNSYRRNPKGAVEALQGSRGFLEILLVRPGRGAWALSVGDGGASDADRKEDGSIEADLAAMRPIEATEAAPAQLENGDVIVVVDPRLMQFYATTFGTAR